MAITKDLYEESYAQGIGVTIKHLKKIGLHAVHCNCENEECLGWKIKAKVGPTGEFPEGKLNENDDGELAVGMTIDNGKVVMLFGTPITWIAFSPEQAIEFANQIIEKAKEV